MKIIFATFLSVTGVFLFIDVIWLSQSFSYFYQPNIGDLLREDVILFPAALFYLIYPLGITVLVVLPLLKKGLLKTIFLKGFVLGFVAYGTYNLTTSNTDKSRANRSGPIMCDTGNLIFFPTIRPANAMVKRRPISTIS